MVKQHELEAAYYHGLRAIGDVDPEVARDLGYDVTPDDFEASIEGAEIETTQQERVAKEVGRVICGDCLAVAPCSHLQPKRGGGFRSVGY